MSINCLEAQGELPLFVGGDLESPGRERVAQHLESCGVCRAALAQAERARSALGAEFERGAAGFPRASAWPLLRARLLAEGLLRSSSLPGAPGWPQVAAMPAARPVRRLWRFASLAAAAAALFLFGTFAGRLFGTAPVPLDGPLNGPLNRPLDMQGSAGSLVLETPRLADGSAEAVISQPAALRRVEPLREVLSADDVMSYRARRFYEQPSPAFNAFAPSGGGSPAGYSNANCPTPDLPYFR
jgi:hypothetical protein